MLTIRLTRIGKKNQPSFRIVAVDKRRSSKAGSFKEELGFLNPLKKQKLFNKERIQYWISKGAKPSPSVFNLLVQEKIIEGKKIAVHNIKKEEAKPAEIVSEVKPEQKAPEIKPVEEVKPVEEAKPAETAPVVETKPTEEQKPVV